jgi:uncharacterized membrane protein YtjA (UPF0391 family)
MSEAFDNFLHVFVPVFGFVLLFGPWPLAVWMSVSLAQQRGRKYGFCFFLVVAVVMGAVYLGGLITASAKAAQDHPGQAAMATGAAVVYSYGILIVALIVRCRLGLKKTP